MKFSLFAALGLAFASPALSQAAPDPAAVSAARDLLRSTGFEQQMEQGALQNVHATFNTIIEAQEQQNGKPMPQELRAAVLKLLQDDTRAVVAEMKPTALEDAARIYSRHFTASEIKQLQELQTNPVMVKAQQVGPSLMTELMQIGIKAAAARQPALQSKIAKLVSEWRTSNK